MAVPTWIRREFVMDKPGLCAAFMLPMSVGQRHIAWR